MGKQIRINAQTGEQTVIELPPPTPEELAAQRAQMRAGIDAERDRRTDAGLTFDGKQYQSRPKDRENVAGAYSIALGAVMAGAQPNDFHWHGGEHPFAWIAADNTLTPMDAPTVLAFGNAMAAHKSGLIFAARDLKQMNPLPTDGEWWTDDKWWPA
jgi:hypothetical protein